MNNSVSSASTALQTVFIVLKLTNLIHWSWLWVLSPMWITMVVAAPFAVLLLLERRRARTRIADAMSLAAMRAGRKGSTE
jgi:hypothetical protein